MENRIYAGWRVVVGATVGLGCSNVPVALASFSIFVIPLSTEFGWSRVEISAAVTFHVVGTILIMPLVGPLVDRWGARRFILGGFALFAITLAQLYWLAGSLLHFYVSYFAMTIAAAGVSPAVFAKVITTWFSRRRGLALGIGMAGSSVGSALAPMAAALALSEGGWRTAYLALAAIPLLVGLPFAAAFIRTIEFIPGQLEYGFVESGRRIANGELRGVDPDRKATGACSDVVATDRALAAFVELTIGV